MRKKINTRSTEDHSTNRLRRNFMITGLAAIFGGLLGQKTDAEEPAPPSTLVTEGEILKTRVSKGKPQVEPLDTMILWERSDENNGRAMTHEILSLQHEELGKNSYPWTIYSHLTTHHVEGDACVLYAKMDKKGAGWSCGLHSEVFNENRAVGVGVNIEMTNRYTGPETTHLIGLNIQALGPEDCQYGIQVHGDRGRFQKGIGVNGKGDIGLDIAGEYGVGIHAHNHSIRLNEGTCIELDGEGKVRIRYNRGRIEFLNGDKCVAHIDMNGEDHSV